MPTVDQKHPDYIDHLGEWVQMRHAYRGAKAIKENGEEYLPMPSGFKKQPDKGLAMYLAYQKRARFPDFLSYMVRGMVGLIHKYEADIQMPDQMMGLWEQTNADGLPLEAFHRRITTELLLPGRYAILVDFPEEGADLPYLAGYKTESLINWSDTRDFFVLDETGLVREGFQWRNKEQYRELVLENGVYIQRIYDSAGAEEGRIIPVNTRGGSTLDFIPLVVANTNDVSTNIVGPPLMGVTESAVAVYQLDADYRHQLFMSGQETLFLYGHEGDLPDVVGAGVIYGLSEGAKAEYVGPAGVGIEAHERAVKNAKEDAVSTGLRLFDRQSGQESGEALRIRYSAQSATLTTIAQTSGQMLETTLRNAAVMLGLDPELVVVKPNLEFVDSQLSPADAEALVRMWMGRAISKLTLYENLQRGGLASEERSFQDEEALIEDEPLDEPIIGDEEPIKEEGVV